MSDIILCNSLAYVLELIGRCKRCGGTVRTCLEQLEHVWNSWNMFGTVGTVGTCLEQLEHVWNLVRTCLEQLEHVWNS